MLNMFRGRGGEYEHFWTSFKSYQKMLTRVVSQISDENLNLVYNSKGCNYFLKCLVFFSGNYEKLIYCYREIALKMYASIVIGKIDFGYFVVIQKTCVRFLNFHLLPHMKL